MNISIFSRCVESFPERPDIDPEETPFTREQVDERIDYWMKKLSERPA